ncbi:hypothetical protein FA95DRAFT_878750 [Auriscalpium vulgare]|uniref:Uncharacterized protein n=1 Tax=Auriscalpium vulgare TaxID=40419 RepID=A0ACB8RZG6_9AGAM|nr:hypothetical protein FA95DRAFT_878750 [Auriscalpium vulgare]
MYALSLPAAPLLFSLLCSVRALPTIATRTSTEVARPPSTLNAVTGVFISVLGFAIILATFAWVAKGGRRVALRGAWDHGMDVIYGVCAQLWLCSREAIGRLQVTSILERAASSAGGRSPTSLVIPLAPTEPAAPGTAVVPTTVKSRTDFPRVPPEAHLATAM